MNSVGLNSKNIVNIVDIFNDIGAISNDSQGGHSVGFLCTTCDRGVFV